MLDTGNESGYLGKNYARLKRQGGYTEAPPFPKRVMLEISNICNHKCTFCLQPKMQRPARHMDEAVFEKIITESYELGAREVSLVGGSEPLANKTLEDKIRFCREIGYEYIYITSNSALGNGERWRRIIDAGIDSVKLSINGGNRESYKTVHGRDDFDKVIANVRAIDAHRKATGKKMFFGVSFVEVPENAATFDNLVELVGSHVDEIVRTPAFYLGKNKPHLPPEVRAVGKVNCYQPFSQSSFSREGYMRVCCNDYENVLAVDDIKEKVLMDAWNGDLFRDFRRRHLDNQRNPDSLKGTLCHSCMYGGDDDFEPVNPVLGSAPKRK